MTILLSRGPNRRVISPPSPISSRTNRRLLTPPNFSSGIGSAFINFHNTHPRPRITNRQLGKNSIFISKATNKPKGKSIIGKKSHLGNNKFLNINATPLKENNKEQKISLPIKLLSKEINWNTTLHSKINSTNLLKSKIILKPGSLKNISEIISLLVTKKKDSPIKVLSNTKQTSLNNKTEEQFDKPTLSHTKSVDLNKKNNNIKFSNSILHKNAQNTKFSKKDDEEIKKSRRGNIQNENKKDASRISEGRSSRKTIGNFAGNNGEDKKRSRNLRDNLNSRFGELSTGNDP